MVQGKLASWTAAGAAITTATAATTTCAPEPGPGEPGVSHSRDAEGGSEHALCAVHHDALQPKRQHVRGRRCEERGAIAGTGTENLLIPVSAAHFKSERKFLSPMKEKRKEDGRGH